jgi:multimeric flavodoxin WrbA
MKIVAVLGSPRAAGNSALITDRFLQAARKLGAETQSFALNMLKYRGCQACMACKKSSDKCVLKDDLAEVLDAVQGADVLVMASPVYYGDVTAQMKAFFDRTYSYFTPDYLQPDKKRSRLAGGKKFVFVLTQGQPDEKYFTGRMALT